jgi:alpha-beta hydrolase superfamily lysophospholipase
MVRWRVLLTLIAVVTVLAGCATNAPARPSDYKRPPRELAPGFAGAAGLPPPNMTDDGPGSLVDVQPLDGGDVLADADATVVRMTYRSTNSANGEITPVSGVIAVPPGQPPRDGWRIVSFGHQITSLPNFCAPSLVEDLAGFAGFVATLVNRGYVVVMSDYQGLGVEGPVHSPLDSATLGNNLIDAVRAARRVVPATSNRWAAYGTGQGGMAAWAADERANAYGAGLELAGAVALSPFADLSELADAASAGTLTRDQYPLLIPLLQSLADADPAFVLDDYRFGLAKDKWDVLLNCRAGDAAERAQTFDQMRPDDLRPRSEAATERLRQALKQAAMPANIGMPPAPILVIYATADPLVPAAGTERAVDVACTKGEPIEIMRRIGDSTTYNEVVLQYSLSWMQSRFDGVPASNICVGAA